MHNIKNVLFVTLKQWKGYEAIQNAMSAVFVRGGLHGGGGGNSESFDNRLKTWTDTRTWFTKTVLWSNRSERDTCNIQEYIFLRRIEWNP